MDPANEKQTGLRGAVLLFVLIVLIGWALRLYRLDAQSVWVDEYFSIGFHNAADVDTYLSLVRFYGYDCMPLGFLAHYFWGRLVGADSILMIRFLSVILSTLCIPVIYALGKYLYGPKAGLIAALLLALSPVHIWIGQSTRPNVLIELVVLISMYAMVRGFHEQRLGWWILNGLANLVLVWTHPFSLLLIFAQGVFMLLSVRPRFWQAAAWAGGHLLIVLSPLAWLWDTLGYVPGAQDDFVLTVPTWRQLLVDWLGDDAVLSSNPFIFPGVTWPFLSEAVQSGARAAHGWLDAALVLFFGACLLWLCVATARPFMRERRRDAQTSPPAHHHAGILLILVATLPLATLTVLSCVWRPCILPRYTSYSSFALYVIAGAALARLPKAMLRRAAVGLAVLLYCYQLSFMLPAPTRTDWLAVDRYVRANASPSDVLLIKGTVLAWEVFRFNAGQSAMPCLPVYSLESLCENSARLLGKSGPTASRTGCCRAVWAVIEPFIYTLPPLGSFEQGLLCRGLVYTRRDFPGMNGLFVYRIERDPTEPIGQTKICPPIPANCDYEAFLTDIGFAPGEETDYADGVAALRRTIDTEWPLTRWYYTWLALQLAYEGHAELAVAAGRRATEIDPGYAFGHFALALVLGEQGHAEEAAEAFQNALAADTFNFYFRYEDLFNALYLEKDDAAARAVFERMDAVGMFLPHVVRQRVGQIPGLDTLVAARAPSKPR